MTTLVRWNGLIASVVPCFEPDERLLVLARSVTRVGHGIFVDDGTLSRAPTSILAEVERLANACVIRLGDNGGVARALNVGVLRAFELGAAYVVTVDQDGGLGSQDIVTLAAVGERHELRGRQRIVVPGRVNGSAVRGRALEAGVIEVTDALQSGMVLTPSLVRKVGLFDETLFIDAVDSEFCLRARRCGIQVVGSEEVDMSHAIGSPTRTYRVGAFCPSATHHPPFRWYYMVRNGIVLWRRYMRREPGWTVLNIRRLISRAVMMLAVERDRRLKVKYAIRGARDGIFGRMGPGHRPS